jgi:hypothetical protein
MLDAPARNEPVSNTTARTAQSRRGNTAIEASSVARTLPWNGHGNDGRVEDTASIHVLPQGASRV